MVSTAGKLFIATRLYTYLHVPERNIKYKGVFRLKTFTMNDLKIPIASLEIQCLGKGQQYATPVLVNEIKDIHIEHVAIKGGSTIVDSYRQGYKIIYLFIIGAGIVVAEEVSYEIVPESILLPNSVKRITIQAAKNNTLHYLRISSKLTDQDLVCLKGFPTENTRKVYFKEFENCQSYTESIKSPNTVSRTILPNKYIPRIAMGTVQTKGPDKVGAHEHPMLEQIFLGLSKNKCTVYADSAKVDFSQHSLLHIPLGSRHSVSVEEDEVMYYVWMDFFLDSKGEEWLKTHIVNDSN